MNHKRKKHKGPNFGETKPHNEGTEVFVLPPNLLEKLGIKLDNILSTQSCPADGSLTHDLIQKPVSSSDPVLNENFKTPQALNKKKESSILETASLMKESVFLSPTFVPTIANVIPGEVEFVRSYESPPRSETTNNKQTENSHSISAQISPKQIDKSSIKDETNSSIQNGIFQMIQINNSAKDESTKTINDFVNLDALIDVNNHHPIPLEENHEKNKYLVDMLMKPSSLEMKYDNLQNDKFSSNSSLNIGITKVIDQKRKIQVINEEVIDVPKLYRCKSLNPNHNNNTLTPVSVHMLLPTAKINKPEVCSRPGEREDKEKVVNLLHDISRAETDVRQSEIREMVVNDVAEHDNVLFDMCNSSLIKTSLLNVFPNTEYKDLVCNGDSNVNGICYSYKDNEQINLEKSKLNDCININGRENTDKNNISYILSAVTTTIVDSNMKQKKQSIDICDSLDLDKMYRCELEHFMNSQFNSGSDLCSFDVLNKSLESATCEESMSLGIIKENISKETNNGAIKTSENKTDSCSKIRNDNGFTPEQKAEKPNIKNMRDKHLSQIWKINEKEINKSRNDLRMAKLCIQGVEKPGGSIEDQTVRASVKVYKNRKKHICPKNQKQPMIELPGPSQSREETEENVKKTKFLKTYKRNLDIIKKVDSHNITDCIDLVDNFQETNEYENTGINLNVVYKTVNFCLCGDFGQLKYYDCDDSYEHIHFWKHSDAISDRDLIFSMYTPENTYNDNSNTSTFMINESPDEHVDKICWNDINDKINCKPKMAQQVKLSGKNIANENHNTTIKSPQLTSESSVNFSKPTQAVGSNEENIDVDNKITRKDVGKNTAEKERSDSDNITCLGMTKTIESQKLVISGSIEAGSSDLKQETENLNMTSKSKKREHSSLEKEDPITVEPQNKKDVKCGVCSQVLAQAEWDSHVTEEHGLIAWKAGETFNPTDDVLLKKVKEKLKKEGVLQCKICDFEMKWCKRYISHVQACCKEKTTSANNKNKPTKKRSSLSKESVPVQVSKNLIDCGVCNMEVKRSDWLVHICQQHNYMAWKSGETPLNLDDMGLVEKHLCNIIEAHGPIICSQCGLDRKYRKKHVKSYLEHIKTCRKLEGISIKKEKLIEEYEVPIVEENVTAPTENTVVMCGVCNQDVPQTSWNYHIGKEHHYLAWKVGENSLDLQDEEQVKQHLYSISKKYDGLICSKCGVKRKYVKMFLDHIKECDGTEEIPSKEYEVPIVEDVVYTREENTDVTCGVCNQHVPLISWIDHIGKEHDYLAWKAGENPLDLQDEEQLRQHLYLISKENFGLICSKCGVKRKHAKVFLKHIKECDGPEEYEVPIVEDVAPSAESSVVTCGVCNQEVPRTSWIDHIENEHFYLAWKVGEQPWNSQDEEQVKQHLYMISKENDGLTCSKCGLKRKYVKAFLGHVKECDGTGRVNDFLMSISMNESQSVLDVSQTDDASETTKCGVCFRIVKTSDWLEHIARKHNYIAWKFGEEPLKLKEDMFEDHLESIMKEHGALSCPKCGLLHKQEVSSVKSYLAHFDSCDHVPETTVKFVKCGVCENQIDEDLWITHIEAKHNYLAWKDGETPLALDDTESLRIYLFTLVNKVDAFKCSKCGVSKRYPKSFLSHLDKCSGDANVTVDEIGAMGEIDTCQCAVCSAIVPVKKWNSHAMDQHYNIAWKVGDFPIDLKSTYGTEKYLKIYKEKKGKLICKNCGMSRVSILGFYAHIVACGKSEEELEEYKNVCEICNNKYLCIYKNQHMQIHKEQEYAKERKLKAEATKKEDDDQEAATPGRRKAAVRANNVIGKLNSTDKFKHTCPTCGFDTDSEKKFARHKCQAGNFDIEENSESGSDDDELNDRDDNVSAEEEIQDTTKKKKNKESIIQAKIPNVPFKYNEVKSYVSQREKEFYQVHFTDEVLFPQWSVGEYEVLTDEQIAEYLPTLEKSCQIKLNNEWNTFDRFETKATTRGHTIFVGASVQYLSWVPSRLDYDKGDNYLAVSCHRGSDCPRYNFDEIVTHSGLIQIWDFGEFTREKPRLVMGITHDYGTVWAMDWCPSGARDAVTSDSNRARLGLLAIACSNGFAYILAVPNLCSFTESGPTYVKLKPVAELRLSMSSERRLYQATAVAWSKQKGHTILSVGYADGTTASYNLQNTSPLLQCTENGMSVMYPYYDEREHNISVTDMDTVAVGLAPGASDAVSSASMGGVSVILRPGATAARLSGHCATGCRFTPGWPSVLIAIDDSIGSSRSVSSNEMDWYGCGRRLGPMRQSGGCGRCGRVLMYAPPLLRSLHALPPYADVRKQNILGIRAQSLTNKKIRPNDELSMRVEPLTYEEVITKYGVEVFFMEPNDRTNSVTSLKEVWSERFPLPDVTAISFCPSVTHHHRAAVGIHAGFVILFSV